MLLLKQPFATIEAIGWMDALFTATSAFTVTGLAVVDIAETFTLFGQFIILALIKIGGIGIITFSILAFMMLGKKIGIKKRIMIQQTLNLDSLGGIVRLVQNIFFYSMIVEAVATVILAIRWVPKYGFLSGLYYSFFHSVSAFNNAGISSFGSLYTYAQDPLINLVITTLFIMGGIGFTVLVDIKNKKNFKKLSLHAKIMIIGTVAFNIISTIVFLLLEFQNPDIATIPGFGNQILSAYFQATTTRTSGFSIISFDNLRTPTVIFMSFLMFVGGGSTSTSGGIKLTTFLVIVLSSFSFIRGSKKIVIGNRTLKERVIIRSFAILTISALLIILSLFTLTITESASALALFFEVISAFSTVGLSSGITAELSLMGRIIVMTLMLFGKIGPLTLAFSLAKVSSENIHYPSEDILTG